MKSPARRAARMPILRSGCMAIGARITEHGLPGSHRAHRPESSRQCRLGGARHEEHGARGPDAGAAALLSAPGIERARGGRRRHSGEGARRGQRRRRRSRTAPSSPARPRVRAPITGNSRLRARWRSRIAGLGAENRAALLFGSERYGLGTEDLEPLQRAGAHSGESRRIARSISRCRCSCWRTSFSWRASSRSRTCSSSSRSRRREMSSISTAHLHQVLNEIDFEDRTGHLMERLRRLFNRAQLDRNELNILRGILSAVQGRRGQSARRLARMSAQPVYLDYAATTPVAPEVAARMAECLTREGTFGNPGSASHAYGEAASASRRGGARAGGRGGRRRGRRRRVHLRRHRGEQPRDFRRRRSITGTRDDTSSRRAPSTNPCSIRARSSSGAAGRVTYLVPGRGGSPRSGARGGGRAARYGAGIHHAREQRDRRDPRCRGDRGSLCPSGQRADTCRRRAERRQVRRRFCRVGDRLAVLVSAQGLRPERGGRPARVAAARRPADAYPLRRRPGEWSALRHRRDASSGRHGSGVRARERCARDRA